VLQMNVLLIKNGVVSTVICADSVTRAQGYYPAYVCVEQPPGVGPGWTTTDNIHFTPPVPIVPSWKITKFALLNRLEPTEIVGINSARQGTGTAAAQMEALWQYLSTANYIDLQATATAGLVDQLVTAGILTSARATTILTTPPVQSELVGGV